jgi:lipopolysaccharide/colanic/teichoic acid biosynthesis glycosyltransferase
LRLGGQARFFMRVRVQLLGALVAGVLLPILLAPTGGIVGYAAAQTLQNSALASLAAILVGFYFHRRLAIFPGVNAGFYILPTFAATYSIAVLLLFFLRLDYSRFHLLASFLLTLSWFFAVTLVLRRYETYRMAIVPGGEADRVEALEGVEWVRLSRPDREVTDVHGLVADLRADVPDEWDRLIADTALKGIPVFHLKQVTESLTGRTEIEHLSENTLGSLNPNQAYLKIKQWADWLAALAALLLLSPLLAVVAIAIRLDSPGPAIFRQERMGYRGEVFRVCKFRTMRQAAPSADGEAARKAAMTRDNDDRITSLGRFLRRSRIDELPQLYNVLCGEMSWIGPRPEALVLSRWYEKELPFYRYRHIVRPGITGWAQINQGHVAEKDEVLEKLHYDFYYIKNFSPWLDLLIILKTIGTMLTGFGAR